MQKASILTAVVFVFSLFLASGAYAQSQGMGPMNPPAYSNAAPGTLNIDSVVPPPTRSDVRSELFNRECGPPARVYVERTQGIPTRLAPSGCNINRTAFERAYGRPAPVTGYYPESSRQGVQSQNAYREQQQRSSTSQGYYPESGQQGTRSNNVQSGQQRSSTSQGYNYNYYQQSNQQGQSSQNQPR